MIAAMKGIVELRMNVLKEQNQIVKLFGALF